GTLPAAWLWASRNAPAAVLEQATSPTVGLDVRADPERESLMNWKTKTFVSFALAAFAGYPIPSRGEDSPDPSRFTYARLYCGADGNTHFQNVTADLRKTDFAPPAPPVHIGTDFPASRAFVGGFDAKWGAHDLETRLNHPTPAIQFGIVLQGIFSI